MRVMIVGYQPLCREALAVLASEELQADSVSVVANFDSVPELSEPVALLLVEPPVPDELDAWLRAASRIPALRRVLIVPERNLSLARAAHARGFHGLLPKLSERPLMVAILKLILAGGEYFPCFEETATAMSLPASIPIERLSKRQQEVWAQMQHGRTNKEIAKTLGISVATVKLHVQAILSAAGARNRTEAVSRMALIAAAQEPGRR